MMMYRYGFWPLMLGRELFEGLFHLVILIDLVLVGVWLWKHIKK